MGDRSKIDMTHDFAIGMRVQVVVEARSHPRLDAWRPKLDGCRWEGRVVDAFGDDARVCVTFGDLSQFTILFRTYELGRIREAHAPAPYRPPPAAGGRGTVDHPPYYTDHPSGIECIDVVEHLDFCRGNAIKYLWRAGLKNRDEIEDLRKARWYVDREIARLEAAVAAREAAAAGDDPS